jgi:5-methylcytosine-specific restriction endonuclease McrA
VAEKTGAEQVTLEQALLFLCEEESAAEAGAGRDADTVCGGTSTEEDGEEGPEPARPVAGFRGRRAYPARVVYQRCPDCARSRVATRDGFVEVQPEEIDRHEGCAEAVAVDGPTPAALRRRILAREGERCANPRCRHRADHCHHIVFRSHGGASDLANEVAVCVTCHALIHAGLLRVKRAAEGEPTWSPAVAADVAEGVDADREASDRLPVLHLAGPRAAGRSRERGAESANADSADGLDVPALAAGLERLGIAKARSIRLIETAIASLAPGERTEVEVLRRALAGS